MEEPGKFAWSGFSHENSDTRHFFPAVLRDAATQCRVTADGVNSLLDRNSHFRGAENRGAIAQRGGARNLPQVYIPAGKGSLPALYLRDAKTRRLISRLKWFISTCIVGAAGLCVIGVAIYASTDIEDGSGMMASLRRVSLAAMTPQTGNIIEDRPALPGTKTDKILATTKGLTTKYLIQDNVVENRNAHEFVRVKPYVRIVASLSTDKAEASDAIPPFNPFDLYADTGDADNSAAAPERQQSDRAANNDLLSSRILELTTGSLLEEDGQEVADDDAERHVAEADAVYTEGAAQLRPAIMPGSDPEGEETATNGQGANILTANAEKPKDPPHTTTIEKTAEEEDANDDAELYWAIVKPGDTLIGILKAVGAEAWQAQSINDALNAIPGGLKLRPGQEVRLRLIPAASDPKAKEPLKVSIFTGVSPVATVERTGGGEYTPTDSHIPAAMGSPSENDASHATLYASVYSACLKQSLEPTIIQKLLRTMGNDVDFKQKVRASDSFELFFEGKQDEDGTEKPGELLYIAMTVGGETNKYYRFRSPNGAIDFYNDRGSNSRMFLIQMPVKTGRFTSGFGYRTHPLLGIRKMHTGVDWAAPIGTPVMAAGNGTVEDAGPHGGNGNYVRIRHGNGYKTAYSHLHAILPGIKKGVKVRQGQQIATLGSSGMSTGPHLHYEVLINNRFSNPLKIRVPRSHQLSGRQFADFKKEGSHIDDLRQRSPVKTQVAAVENK